MRTTLSLDEDVAVLLRQVRQKRKTGLKQTVNEALRQGLRQLAAPPSRREPYRTQAVSLGRCLLGGLDDVAEALAVAEGESFR
jgi:predicted flavoprotein YhiN